MKKRRVHTNSRENKVQYILFKQWVKSEKLTRSGRGSSTFYWTITNGRSKFRALRGWGKRRMWGLKSCSILTIAFLQFIHFQMMKSNFGGKARASDEQYKDTLTTSLSSFHLSLLPFMKLEKEQQHIKEKKKSGSLKPLIIACSWSDRKWPHLEHIFLYSQILPLTRRVQNLRYFCTLPHPHKQSPKQIITFPVYVKQLCRISWEHDFQIRDKPNWRVSVSFTTGNVVDLGLNSIYISIKKLEVLICDWVVATFESWGKQCSNKYLAVENIF